MNKEKNVTLTELEIDWLILALCDMELKDGFKIPEDVKKLKEKLLEANGYKK